MGTMGGGHKALAYFGMGLAEAVQLSLQNETWRYIVVSYVLFDVSTAES